MKNNNDTRSASIPHNISKQVVPLHVPPAVSSFSTSRNQIVFLFSFIFLIFFFSARSTKIGTPQSISSIRCKVWSVENHEHFTKPILELGNSNRSPSEFFLNFLISVWLAKPVNPMCKNSIAFREKKERLNRSSERKVMPVLRRTLRCRVLWRSRWNRVGRKRWDDGSGVWITQPN